MSLSRSLSLAIQMLTTSGNFDIPSSDEVSMVVV